MIENRRVYQVVNSELNRLSWPIFAAGNSMNPA
jgi:hypothetical protein